MHKHIAVADDDPMIIELIHLKLRDLMGYRVTLYRDGEQALIGVLKDFPDLLILDLSMPKMNGFETLHHLRIAAPDLPILLLTGQIMSKEQALEAGATEYMAKPFSLAALGETVEKLVTPHHTPPPRTPRKGHGR